MNSRLKRLILAQGRSKQLSEATFQSGRIFSFRAGEDGAASIKDVAHGLSNINRYCGQTDDPISVACHSLLVSKLLELEDESAEIQLMGLLHDCEESIMGDIPHPFFHSLSSHAQLEIAEKKWEVRHKILNSLGVKYNYDDMEGVVKSADMVSRHLESRYRMNCAEIPLNGYVEKSIAKSWELSGENLDEYYLMDPYMAHDSFIQRFTELRAACNEKSDA